jgi:hypothetical protein
MPEIDAGELERLSSALRLAESALEEALEAAENLGNFDRRFDVPRALGGAQRLEHLVYALLALPIFAVSIFIIVLIATLGSKNP